ncbi:MAG: hypothetical protein OXG88_10565 [Gammaproteobacteria bacterium]|nr:hypothetical protein [Gammaproteobacteria bacterium]
MLKFANLNRTTVIGVVTYLVITSLVIGNTIEATTTIAPLPETPTTLTHKEVKQLRENRQTEIDTSLSESDLDQAQQKLVSQAILKLETFVPHCSFKVTTNVTSDKRKESVFSKQVTAEESGTGFFEHNIEHNSTEGNGTGDVQITTNISASYTGGFTNLWDLSSIRVKDEIKEDITFVMDFDIKKLHRIFGEESNSDLQDNNPFWRGIQRIFSRIKHELIVSEDPNSPITLRFRLTKPTNLMFGVKLRKLEFENSLTFNEDVQEYLLTEQKIEIRGRAFLFWGVHETIKQWFSDYECDTPLRYIKVDDPAEFMMW